MKSKNIIIVLLSFIGGVYVQADNLFERNPHWRLEDMEAHWKGRWYDVGDPEEVNGKIYFKLFYMLDQCESHGLQRQTDFYRPDTLLRKIREENGRILVDYEDYKNYCTKAYVDYIPYKKTDGGELVLYDFNMKVGNKYGHVEGYDDVWVSEIRKIAFDDGKIRKLFILSNGLKIVEGIGCLCSEGDPLLRYLNPNQWERGVDKYLGLFEENETQIFSQTREEALSDTSLERYLVYHDFWNKGLYYSISFTSDSEVKVACYSNPNPTGTYWGTVAIPESVEHEGDTYRVTGIDDYAFGNSPLLYSITLPGSVSSIGQEAFSGCTGLTEITCKAAVPPICEADCFLGVGQRDCKLYVPEVSVEAYRNAPVWQNFDIIATDFSGIEGISAEGSVRIYASGGSIVLENLSPGMPVAVYDTTGHKVKTVEATGSRMEVALPAGFYVVECAGKVEKVMLRALSGRI